MNDTPIPTEQGQRVDMFRSKVDILSLLVILAALLTFKKVGGISSISQCLAAGDHINAVSWSPNGETLLVATSSGLYLYRSDTEFAIPQIIENVTVPVNDVAFSPDGTTFVVASLADSSASIYDASTLALIETLETPYDGLTRLAFNSGGNLLAAVSVKIDPDTSFPYDYLIRIWDIPSEVKITDVVNVGLSIDSIGFTADDKYLLIDAIYPGYGKSEVRFWNLNDERVDSVVSERVILGDIAPNGSMISVVTKDLMDNDEIRILDSTNTSTIYETATEANITASAFDAQANFIAIGDATGNISIYSIQDRVLIDTIKTDFDGIKDITFTPDGEDIVVVGNNGMQETALLVILADDALIPLIQPCV